MGSVFIWKGSENDKSFLDQFLDLLKVIPQPGVRRGENSPNSNYSFYGKDMKDCFYVFGGRRSEDVMYSSSIYDSKHVADSYFVKKLIQHMTVLEPQTLIMLSMHIFFKLH